MADIKKASSSRGANNGRKKKLKLRPVWYVVLVLLAIAFIVMLVRIWPKGSEEPPATVNVIGLNSNIQTIEETRAVEQTSVKINLASCKVTIGTSFTVTATVMPAQTDKSLQWKSSDDKVFRVSSQGTVEVVGEGTAALTATVGDVSDAIVIEGVNDKNDKSQMNLPDYDDVKDNGREDNSRGENATGEQEQPSSGQQTTQSQPVAPTMQPTVQPSVVQPSTQAAVIPTVPSTQTAITSSGLRSSQLADILPQRGYEGSGDNVYVYGEGDSYAGEIIVQPNLVIIYVKKNTAEFENSVKDILSELLPDEYEQVWNNYRSASTDRTFTVEGRKVRIVTAGNGGHSQIVVYN